MIFEVVIAYIAGILSALLAFLVGLRQKETHTPVDDGPWRITTKHGLGDGRIRGVIEARHDGVVTIRDENGYLIERFYGVTKVERVGDPPGTPSDPKEML